MSIFKVADEVKVDLFRQSMPQIMDALGQCTPDGDLSADDVIDFFAVCLASLLDNDTNLRTPRDIRLGVEVIGKHIERHTKAFRTVNAETGASVLSTVLAAGGADLNNQPLN